MSATRIEIRRGAYYDSVVLMHLQRSLAALPGVVDAGVIMGTAANKELLEQSDLLPSEASGAAADDLLIVVRAGDDAAAEEALASVDTLLQQRSSASADQDYLPQSLESAVRMMPEAQWVLVSVPGRYAAGVARDALRHGKHLFLYSDNVSLEDEIELKQSAATRNLLVMGPDCGTAIIGGVGLGFANKVRRGPIGLVGASGTGLQAVTARIHALGGGITHALGTGGRDLSAPVGAATARQGLELLSRDADTTVIVLISKPPAPEVAKSLLDMARRAGKPVVINFIGYPAPARRDGNLYFATTLDEAASLAVELSTRQQAEPPTDNRFEPRQRYLRGLFSGGTLAYEALLLLSAALRDLYSNIPLEEEHRLANPLHSHGHTILDLGADEFTVGRLHPMMDNDLRVRRLKQEAEDPEVAVILLDLVLGYGAHPDPAAELAPAIAAARATAANEGRHLEVVVMVIGTDEDPQDLEHQVSHLHAAGAHVKKSSEDALRYALALIEPLNPITSGRESAGGAPVASLSLPLAAINVGLDTFTESLTAQGAAVLHVNWRPPAAGNDRLISLLERMKGGA